MTKKALKQQYDDLEIEYSKLLTRNHVLEQMFESNNGKIAMLEARLKEIGEIIEAYRASF